MTWCLPAALGLVVLTGCAVPGPARVCAPELAASLPLVPSPHLVVEGRLNRQPARFLLDTGAEASHVTPEAAVRYGLARAGGRTTVTGLGGRVVAENVLGEVEIGGMAVRRRLSVVGLPFRVEGGMPYAGILGSDLLSGHDMEVAASEGVVRLWRTPDCSGDYVPWRGRHWSVPLQRTEGGRLLLTTVVDGRELPALLDSGANVTVLSDRAARRLDLTADMLARDRAGVGRGVGGGAIGSRTHRFETLQVGPERIAGPRLVVSGIDNAEGDMLLGLDWMRLRPVWISWSSRQVFLRPMRAPPPPAEGPGGMPAAAGGAMVGP